MDMIGFIIGSLLLTIWFAILWHRGRAREKRLEENLARHQRDETLSNQLTQRRAEMLHRLVDGIDDGLFIVSQTQQVIFCNRGAVRMFPHQHEVVGKSFLECVKDHRIAEVVCNSAKISRRMREDLLLTSPDEGAEASGMAGDRVYSVEAVPLSKNEPAGLDGAVLVVIRDETQKHQLEKIRKDFVANASHELRTPLSIIIGYLENLQEGDITDPAEIHRAFTLMKKHGDRLASIVEDLLVISRMESGQADTLRLEKFHFGACAHEVVNRLQPMIATAGAEVLLDFDPEGDVQLFGDRFYWDQILFNLIGNALKENTGNSLKIIVNLFQEEHHSMIEVRDNGVGIPNADLPFVFKRFYRVSRPHTRDIKGTGLGLSIVKRAVEAHRGTITVSSKPGVETVFTIRVPRGTKSE